jgi:hypothetical protein
VTVDFERIAGDRTEGMMADALSAIAWKEYK